MALSWLIWAPLLAGISAWLAEKNKPGSANWISLLSLLFIFVFALALVQSGNLGYQWLWFERFNIYFSLWYDGLSQLMVLLTLVLAMLAVLVSWREIDQAAGLFHFNLMFSVAGILGVFLAKDLFLFFLFWEVMLIPMTALILVWGHEQRRKAAMKFFIFTQVSGLLMLVAIIALAVYSYQTSGQFNFDIDALGALNLDRQTQYWIMLGFFLAFAVKLPTVPFHTWLPDAHTQAPTAASVLLAGILLKTGAYGLIRIVMPLFPEATQQFAPVAVSLGAFSIVYGAVMAFSQSDFKRLVAYSSISHMGFVLLALFSWQALAIQGAILTLVAHGLSSAALFSIAGMIQHRIHSRELGKMGGIWHSAPKLATFTLIFVMAGIGLPGFANFNGELFSLLGSFAVFPVPTAFAALGITGSAIYGLHLFQRAFQGPAQCEPGDLTGRELLFVSLLTLALLYFGLQPHGILALTYENLQFLLTQLNQPEGIMP